ncbi:MAG: extracellular solute-binding protein [Alphaproteobacteria bacterium]|nr:extracellular solute-binding protein [Alphaproteobacteria bacterium]
MRWIFALLLFFPSAAAYADSTHALAMHGQPRYPADYKYFDYVNPAAPKGGDLKTSKNGSFDNLNGNIILGNSAEGLELLNDKLMQRAWNEPFTLYGLVAESIDIAPDRSWIIFHLNKKARFHDGVPMTAADVKFSYESYLKYGHPVRRRVYGLIKDVKILSDHDIKFTFGKGYDRESVMILAMMQVLPKHYWEKHDISKTTLETPLGSGPYKIKSVEPGRKIVYERVKDYWAKDLPVNVGLYNFDTITYTYYRDDDIALESFKAGDYNLRQEYNIHKWKTAYDFKALDEGRVVRQETAHHRPEWLRAMVFNTRRPAFQDRRVREALGLMFNFDWVNKNLFFGAFKRIGSVFPNSELAATGKPEGEELASLKKYKDQLPPEVFGAAWQPPSSNIRENQRKAIELLKSAGWVYRDQALVNEKTGEAFSFEILLNDRGDEKIALEFSRSLKKIGIAARVRTVDSAQFVGRLDAFDYDMVMYRWINSLSPGNEQLNYWGTAAAETKGSRNYAGIESPAVDGLAAGIAQASERQTLVARARALDRAIMWGYYMIPMHYLGMDLVAHAAEIRQPDVVPVYGIVREAWWFQSQP